MKLFSYLFGAMHIIGYSGLVILFLWIEWLYLSSNFMQIFNPFLHFQVLYTLVKTPLAWLSLSLSVVGFFASAGVEKIKENL